MNKFFIASILLISLTKLTYAQDNGNSYISSSQNPSPYTLNGYIGYSTYKPQLRKGFEIVDDWKGAEITFGDLAVAFYGGSHRKEGADSSVASPDGRLVRIGYRLGKDFNINFGKTSFSSATIKPFVQISAMIAQIPNVVLTEGNIMSAGLGFSPGLLARFSHIYAAAQYDFSMNINTTVGGNGKYNLGKGYLRGLSLTLGFENAFDLLGPHQYTAKGRRVEIEKSSKEGYGYDRYGELHKYIVTTTVTTKTPGEVSLQLISPFWGIGPSYSFRPRSRRHAETNMKGLSLASRFGYLMIDGFFEQGVMGSTDEVGREEILITYPQLRDYDFSAQVNTTKYGGRIGVNLAKFLALLNFEQTTQAKNYTRWRLPYISFYGFFTYGNAQFEGTPRYTFEGASKRLLDYQNQKGIEPSASNNPDFIPESSVFSGFGGSFEIGSAYIRYTHYKYKDAPILDYGYFSAGANIPLGRIINRYQLKAAINKRNRKS